MRKYTQLSQFERDRIEAMQRADHKQKEIAEVLKRSPGTISREIERNSYQSQGYESNYAQFKFRNRERSAKYQWSKINKNEELKEYIMGKLQKYWSPDQISGRMKLEEQPFFASKNSIYRWFDTPYGDCYQQYLYSGRNRMLGRKKNRKKDTPQRRMIPNRISINQRPCIAGISGHWEADTVVPGKKTSSKTCLSVASERKTMFLRIQKILNLKPDTFAASMINIKNEYRVKSFTFDNGLENKSHEKIGTKNYFCDPYSSWQKGKIEGLNKMIRWFIKKGSDISQYSDEYVKMVEYVLNNKPRKSLKYLTPYEAMLKSDILKTKKQPYESFVLKFPLLKNCA